MFRVVGLSEVYGICTNYGLSETTSNKASLTPQGGPYEGLWVALLGVFVVEITAMNYRTTPESSWGKRAHANFICHAMGKQIWRY